MKFTATIQIFNLLFFNVLIQLTTFAQQVKKNEPNNIQFNQNIELKVSDLELNGILTSQLNQAISQSDLVKLRNFDFKQYRSYSKSQEVQIEDGPVIVLYSIEFMISKGQQFENQFLFNKKNTDETTVIHPIIPVVNIGFGKSSAIELH